MSVRSTLSHPAARVGVIAGGVVLLAVVLLSLLFFLQRDQVLPNTFVAAIDVSGMTAEEVTDALTDEVEARETDPITFRFEGEEHVLIPREVGYRVDADATAQAALARGREGLPGDIITRLRAFRRSAELDLVEHRASDGIEQWVDDLADRLDREEVRGGVEIDPEGPEVRVTASQGEVVVDRTAALQLATAGLRNRGPETFDLPADTTIQPIEDQVLADTAAAAEDALAEPLVLRSEDASLELSPADLAALLVIEESGVLPGAIDLQLTVPVERVEEELAEIAAERFEVEPTPASYSASRTPPTTFDAQADATFRPVAADVEVVPGQEGRAFDAELAAEQLTELVRAASREAELRLEEIEGEFPTSVAEELRPTHAIGTFTTYYTAGQVRNQNIQLLADVIDGALVLPGEQFSINEISGPRSCEKGYQPAGTIVRGELVDTCGGGTSQFGTTTMNAAFFAGVQLDQWRAHSWYISRYPIGREATLNYPVLDVKFTNNTEGAILVKTAHTATSVTVTLYGVPRAEAVTARHGARTQPRSFETEERDTSELFEDQERVVQSGTDGFTIQVRRIVELVGGGTEERTINTTYVPQTRIVEQGTRPRPGADDDDEDDADEAEDDDEDDEDDD